MDKDYLKESQLVKDRATSFLEEHKILEILKEFGEPHFYGSFELDLMNRADIDIALVVDKLSFELVAELAKKLNKEGFNKYWIFDNSNKNVLDNPKHTICEVGYGFFNPKIKTEDKWEIGIAICEKDELENTLKLTNEVKQSIENNPELKELIIRLKYQLAEKYGDHKYRGTVVYNAVLKDKVTSVEEIEKLA